MERIHAQLSQDGYRVDAEAIAEAIIRRLLAGRTVEPETEER